MKDIKQLVGNLQMACQTPEEACSKPEQDETLARKQADKLWDVMTGLYTSKWTRKNGELADKLWIKALMTLSKDQIRLGVQKCEEKIFKGDQWPPDLAEWLAMIHGHSDIDFMSAFHRCLEKRPEGRIETWVYEKASYNIKRMGHEQAERSHRKWMLEAIELDKKGELMLNAEILAKALPEKIDRNLNDIKRQEFEESGKKNPFQDRINKLKAIKR